MSYPAKEYKFGGRRHLSRFWKVSVHNSIYHVLVLSENPDGTITGELLYTKDQYLRDIEAQNARLVPDAIEKFTEHDQSHPSARSDKMTQLILVEGKGIKFVVSNKVADIAVYSYECFESPINKLVHRFGQNGSPNHDD